MSDVKKAACLAVALALLAGCGGEEPSEISEQERRDLAEGLFGLPGGGSGGGGLLSGLNGQGGTVGDDLPADFPQVMDTGGMGAGAPMPSWGGDPTKDQQGNRAALKRTPVILVHGNGTSAYGSLYDSMWNLKWDSMVKRLKDLGYNSSEIWAVSFLGRSPVMAQLQDVYSTNIDDVRNFIEAVRQYLGVQKVDIIAHSLGVQLAKGYMVGLQRDKKWDHSQHHLDAVGTLVALSGATYGLGKQFDMYASIVGEMLTDFPFEKASHSFQGTVDDTPRGPVVAQQQPVGGTALGSKWKDADFRGQTALDGGKITYVAIWHAVDLCDKLWDNTARLHGANLNHEVNHISTDAMQAHVGLLHDQQTFDLFAKHLNKVGVVWAKGQPQGQPQTPGWTCKATQASTYGHYVFGRGSLCNGWHVCAKGSGEDLGMLSMLTKVWVAETKSGYFQKGPCP